MIRVSAFRCYLGASDDHVRLPTAAPAEPQPPHAVVCRTTVVRVDLERLLADLEAEALRTLGVGDD